MKDWPRIRVDSIPSHPINFQKKISLKNNRVHTQNV